MTDGSQHVAVIGAGPAGLTAAYELAKRSASVEVFESDDVVGGISRTVERDGWRFDIGGHRFFTKVRQVEELWHEILPDEDFLLRPRMSRIYYRGKLYDYPLKAMNALRNLGIVEAVRCVGSYLLARVRPPKDQTHFEGWVSARFGWRLYSIFFKTYTEKVWGMPATSLQAAWAAQRIKNLSLLSAVMNALRPKRNQKEIASLIEEFQYPKYGPGMMWQRCAELIEKQGGSVQMQSWVKTIHRDPSTKSATGITVTTSCGDSRFDATHVISSMPLSALITAMEPEAPAEIIAAAGDLRYRDFLTIALVVPQEFGFPDNWIYIHEPGVQVGRIQNYGSWSPYLVKDGMTCLGLEYFVNEGDELWDAGDNDLLKLGTAELERLGLVQSGAVKAGYVVRMPKCYPVYDEHYAGNLETIGNWLASEVRNVHPIGRNGMHRYNNQDHSMMTAMLTVENILDETTHNIWEVNVDEEYQEESRTHDTHKAARGTGRMAPVTPRQVQRQSDISKV